MKNMMIGISLLSLLAFAGCADEESNYLDDDFWSEDEDLATDRITSGGMPDPGWEVWNPINAWTDSSPNGGTYEEYYEKWLAEIQYTDNGSRGEDVMLTLSDGSQIPAPNLRCSNTAMFLRFLFAMDNGLPMIMAGGGQYFGHFGWLNRNGTHHTSYSHYPLDAAKGSYSRLQNYNTYEKRECWDDSQTQCGIQEYPFEGAHLGQYLDAVLENKRFGFFIANAMNMLYSGNIVESSNTYYLQPQYIRGGDLQMHRSSTDGVGHTITIMKVDRAGSSLAHVDVIQSYMPTFPWVVDGYSELTSYDADPEFGGGLRRWRRATLRSGRWYNEVPDTSVVGSAGQVSDNPELFKQLFSMDTDALVESLVSTINTARVGQYDNPNSCRRREDRETAFQALYEFYFDTPELLDSLGLGDGAPMQAVEIEVDRLHRTVDDFIWAEMVYEDSWVCHWNPDGDLNHDMYEATVQRNRELIESQGCEALLVFRAQDVERSDGTDGFKWLEELLGTSNTLYSNDENGSLGHVTTDRTARTDLVEWFCEVYEDIDYFAGY